MGRDHDGISVPTDSHLGKVDLTIPETIDRLGSRLALPPDGSLNPGGEFPRAKGFCHVIVRSKFEQENLVRDF